MARWDRVIRSAAADRASSGPGVCLSGAGAKEGLGPQVDRTVRSLRKGGRMSVFFGPDRAAASTRRGDAGPHDAVGTSTCSGSGRPPRAGGQLAVVGPSGAGKSTVLRLLAGLQLHANGELRLFDQPQTYLRLDQTDPPDVRLVFQNPLLASLTVEENVGFLLRERAQRGRRSVIVSMPASRRSGLRRGPPLCRELSGGMRSGSASPGP